MSSAISQEKGRSIKRVFVTGAPRSGTSWLGEILAKCARAKYVYEPFNAHWNPKLNKHLLHFQYASSSTAVSEDVAEVAARAFEGKQSANQVMRAIYRGYWNTLGSSKSLVLVKDPTAVLMTDWISHRTHADVLIIVRHPCGFASSISALDWNLNVDHLRVQENLMQDFLGPYEDLLIRARNDPWLTLGAYWSAIHVVLFEQLQTNRDWQVCKYEEMCRDPLGQFSIISEKLGFNVPRGNWNMLEKSTTTQHYSRDPGSTRRESARMPDKWRKMLSPHQIDAVEGMVREFGLEKHL
ncbi:MAG: sulfotransferase [Halioglobus sp.]